MKNNLNSLNPQPQLPTSDYAPRFVALGLLAGILLALALTGCNSTPKEGTAQTSGGAGDTNAEIAGKYTLVTLNGNPVPCVVSHEGSDVTVKSGLFTINPDGTCRSESVFSLPRGRDVNRVVDATYTVSGSELLMRWKGAGQTRGTVKGNDFTMDNEGMIFGYRK